MGGSLAGLLAARVLSDYFERVTIIERDVYPTKPEARRGTPQANHVHGLMPRGRMILEQLFPGLQTEMMSWGAPLVDMAKDVAWLTPQGWGVNFESNLEVLSLRIRDTLETSHSPQASAWGFAARNEFLSKVVDGESSGGDLVRLYL